MTSLSSIPLSSLDITGAVDGQTIVYSSAAQSWIPGSSIAISTIQNVGSNTTSFNFTGIPSSAKKVTVMLYDMSTYGTSSYLIRLGSGSILYSGYNSASLAGPLIMPPADRAVSSSGFVISGNMGYYRANGTLTLTTIGSNKWVGSGMFSSSYMSWTVGSVTLGGVLDRIQITTTNGSERFATGSANIMWE
jgi:hypothetical protein